MSTCKEIAELDPYTFLAVVGKKVLHPGGRQSTEQMFRLADFTVEQAVLDIGCGVGSTAIQIATRFGCRVKAVDIDRNMLDGARHNARTAGFGRSISFEQGDMRELRFADDSFDVVTVEAVTMFTGDQQQSVREAVRVCKPGGMVLDHELVWLQPSHKEQQGIFHREICPGAEFGMLEDWIRLYRSCGNCEVKALSTPFDMITPSGLLRDEGVAGLLRMLVRCGSRWCCLKKMARLTGRLWKIAPYMGTVVIAATKPVC